MPADQIDSGLLIPIVNERVGNPNCPLPKYSLDRNGAMKTVTVPCRSWVCHKCMWGHIKRYLSHINDKTSPYQAIFYGTTQPDARERIQDRIRYHGGEFFSIHRNAADNTQETCLWWLATVPGELAWKPLTTQTEIMVLAQQALTYPGLISKPKIRRVTASRAWKMPEEERPASSRFPLDARSEAEVEAAHDIAVERLSEVGYTIPAFGHVLLHGLPASVPTITYKETIDVILAEMRQAEEDKRKEEERERSASWVGGDQDTTEQPEQADDPARWGPWN